MGCKAASSRISATNKQKLTFGTFSDKEHRDILMSQVNYALSLSQSRR
jgi:hypothetical protein